MYTEKDKSLSIIDASAIVSAGDRSQMKFLKVNDHVTFLYAGVSYMGIILGMSGLYLVRLLILWSYIKIFTYEKKSLYSKK